MKLTDLKEKQTVSIVVKWGGASSETATQVAEVKGDTVLLQPFKYKDLELDLSSSDQPDMEFDLYANEPENDTRLVWNNVTISLDKSGEGMLYAVQQADPSAQPTVSERRKESRMTLDIPGIIPAADITASIPITVHDISTSGISVLVPTSHKVTGNKLSIAFSDIVNNDAFVIPMQCDVIRSVVQPRDILKVGGTTLYGCTIAQTTPDLVTYILAKRTLQKAGK